MNFKIETIVNYATHAIRDNSNREKIKNIRLAKLIIIIMTKSNIYKTIETWRKTFLLIPKCLLFKYTIQTKEIFQKNIVFC